MRRLSIIAWMSVVMLAACGGTKTLTGTSTTGTGGTGGTTTLSLGSGTGASFQPGIIAISTTSLSAGGSTSLQVSLVDKTGALYTTSTVITFSSPCAGQGLATIAASSVTPASPTVTTTTGTASATYAAKGCSGSDVITATATANNQSLTATGTVTVAQAAIGSILFVSASRPNIAVKGTGGIETAALIFQVLDTSGGPRAGATVSFALNTAVGGISRSPATATTDANGNVQTIVSAGTVATTVRVTATTQAQGGASISTQSSALTVSTGIPTSQNISLAVQCPNQEAWDLDGVIVPVTVRMTDRYSNPVPDGTTANFQTTLGGIGGTCLTQTTTGVTGESGVCTVNWVSKDPRSVNGVVSGRSPLLVTAIGEESFKDANGNGVFDPEATPGDIVAFNPVISTTKAWDDTQEPFLNVKEHYDGNQTPVFDAGDPFIDFNSDGQHNIPDGKFNGLLCQGSPCSTQTSVAIGASNIIIMSSSTAVITPAAGNNYTIGTGQTLFFQIADIHNQQMPALTKVDATVSPTSGFTIVGTASYIWPCNSAAGGGSFAFSLSPPATGAKAGTLFITVTTPGKVVTTAAYNFSP
jgi:hypothetical protein